MSLVNVGTVAFDAIETPFGKTDKIIGGACTYISLAASYFTKGAKIVSVVGDDFPQDVIDMFSDRDISTEGLQVKQGEKTFFWSGKYHADMNSRDTIDTQLNVLETFDPIIPDAYQDCEYLMLGNLAPQAQLQVIDRLEKRPKLIVLDTMNFWMEVALDDLLTVIKEVDVLTINDEEARLLSGEYSLRKAAKKILTMGPKYLIIKKGEHGALLFNDERVFFAPALPLEEVFDPTGAGDTFAGGFIGYLASSGNISWENMKNAIIMGSALASFTVEKFGIERLRDLTMEEIADRISQFAELTNFTMEYPFQEEEQI
ncbi:PfkB family carbohydrate kinase [Parvicella tangerina]|uniref:Ribokinase n=1 Tax=Parvicella tangerina TaxID=2829795 RepID=A0A916JIB4_9FLAO|nr:PfkB family carbohydrate kinase [Parvicella tangerina]CAG5076597.1 Ribokinase [Parvicella tangerina]